MLIFFVSMAIELREQEDLFMTMFALAFVLGIALFLIVMGDGTWQSK
ncbi:MAG TPA: hypothetical protein VK709_09130 [Candidatus Saccharimonadales bacterium]|jgi:hypothetical protein|nr:hypothetical protein [Candidatus Saccharimonadales bacterium]